MSDKKSNAGRPTKYNPEMLPKIIELMKEGASKVEVCAELDISNETLVQWCDPNGRYYIPEFSETVKRGVELSKAWWLRQGRINLMNKDFSATLFYMNMKNRHGWRDKTDINTTGSLVLNISKEDEDL